MALGDPVRLMEVTNITWVERVSTIAPEADFDPQDLLRKRVFAETATPSGTSGPQRWGSPGASNASREWLGNSLKAILPAPLRSFVEQVRRRIRAALNRPQSLINAMTRVHDVVLYGTSTGLEAISVPFPHIIFLTTSRTPEFKELARQQIADYLSQWWSNLVDPMVGIRTLFLDGSDNARNEIVAYFGRGIFAPLQSEPRIGRVEIRNLESGSVGEPVLPGNIPAGIYRGQSALTFSPREGLAPATAKQLPDEEWLLFLRGPLPRESGEAPFALFAHDRSANRAIDARPVIDSIVPPREGFEASFRISRGRIPVAEVSVTDDARPSRLHTRAPRRNVVLAIIGVVQPVSRDGSPIRRWWVDLDRSGSLAASAMRPAAISVMCEGGRVFGFDWEQPARAVRPRAALGTVAIPGSELTVLWAEGGTGFGFIVPPERRRVVSFGDPRAPAGSSGEGFDSFSLDWLDFAGAAETEAALGFPERNGLLADLQFGSSLYIPGTADPAGALPGCLARARPDVPFEFRWDGAWKAGTEMILGPLVLRIVHPQIVQAPRPAAEPVAAEARGGKGARSA